MINCSFNENKITEYGNHDELMKLKDGVYKKNVHNASKTLSKRKTVVKITLIQIKNSKIKKFNYCQLLAKFLL